MTKNASDIPEQLILHTLEQLQQAQLRATAASSAVDSVLGFLFTHETRLVPQLTLLKENLSYLRHLAEFLAPPVQRRLEEMLADERRKSSHRGSQSKKLAGKK